MKKFFIVIIFFISNLYAMDQCDILSTITDKDTTRFSHHLSIAVSSVNRMLLGGMITPDNSMYLMLSKLNKDMRKSSNNIKQVIIENGLKDRIESFKNITDSNALVIFARKQLADQQGEVDFVKRYLDSTIYTLTNLDLQQQYPSFIIPIIGNPHANDRIKFIQDNAAYPSEDEAQKGYLALFIYQTLFATKN